MSISNRKYIMSLALTVYVLAMITVPVFAGATLYLDSYNGSGYYVEQLEYDTFTFDWTITSADTHQAWEVRFYQPIGGGGIQDWWGSIQLNTMGGYYYWFDVETVQGGDTFEDIYGEPGPWVDFRYSANPGTYTVNSRFSLWYQMIIWPYIFYEDIYYPTTDSFMYHIEDSKSGQEMGTCISSSIPTESPINLDEKDMLDAIEKTNTYILETKELAALLGDKSGTEIIVKMHVSNVFEDGTIRIAMTFLNLKTNVVLLDTYYDVM